MNGELSMSCVLCTCVKVLCGHGFGHFLQYSHCLFCAVRLYLQESIVEFHITRLGPGWVHALHPRTRFSNKSNHAYALTACFKLSLVSYVYYQLLDAPHPLHVGYANYTLLLCDINNSKNYSAPVTRQTLRSNNALMFN